MEQVLGASVLTKKIAMNDEEKMAAAGMDTSGAKLELEVSLRRPLISSLATPGTPRGLLDDRLKDPKRGEITTDQGSRSPPNTPS